MTWERSTLGEIASWSSGGTPSAGTASFYGGDIPWLLIGDLTDGAVTTPSKTITGEGLANSSAKWVPQDAVLVAMYGSIGKLGLTQFPVTTNQAIAAAVSKGRVVPKFLFYYLLSQRSSLAAAGKGATQKNIGQGTLKAWPIYFPSALDEQRRIVELVEEHLSHLDAADAALAANLARLDGLESRLAEECVTGAAQLGDRRPAQLDSAGTADGALPSLPSGWRWDRLGNVADVVGGVTKDAKKQSDPTIPEVPYLRVANVKRAALDLGQVTMIRVPETKAQALRLLPGDVLMNEGGDRDKLARGWVWQGEIDDCIHQNHVFRARLRTDLNPYFLSWTANTFGQRWAERNGKQSVNLASISLSMIRKMPVVVAPGAESDAAIQQLHQKLDATSALRKELEKGRARSAALRRAILAAAFSGRLTGFSSDTEVIEEMAEVAP